MTAWVKLEAHNDWGYGYLVLPGTHRGSADANKGIAFKSGDLVRVRWPDGTVEFQTVVMHTQRYTVGDMGHTYEVDYPWPRLLLDRKGVGWSVGLDEVEVDPATLPTRRGRRA